MYQVSGRVTDFAGVGIAGVTVSTGARQAITDSSGNYVIAGRDLGVYAVVPSKSGYTFCSRARAFVVPPSQTDQDFAGSPVGIDLGFCPNSNGFSFANRQLWRSWPMFEQFYGSEQVRKDSRQAIRKLGLKR